MEKRKMARFQFKNEILDLTSLVINSTRIKLKSISIDYAEEIFQEFTKEITVYMIPKPASSIKETAEFISQSIENMKAHADLILAILNNENNEFLGCCGLHCKETGNTPVLGIWLKKGAHGKKYGLEAIRALLEWCKNNIMFDYLIYPVDKKNISSRKIPESLDGIIFQKAKVKTMNNTYLDEVVYKIENKNL